MCKIFIHFIQTARMILKRAIFETTAPKMTKVNEMTTTHKIQKIIFFMSSSEQLVKSCVLVHSIEQKPKITANDKIEICSIVLYFSLLFSIV